MEASPPIKEDVNVFMLDAPQGTYTGVRPTIRKCGAGNKDRLSQACSMPSCPPLGAKRAFQLPPIKADGKNPFRRMFEQAHGAEDCQEIFEFWWVENRFFSKI